LPGLLQRLPLLVEIEGEAAGHLPALAAERIGPAR